MKTAMMTLAAVLTFGLIFSQLASAAPSLERKSGYGCGGPDLTGREVYYRFESPISGQATVTLTPHRANLDLVVTGANAQRGCEPANDCLASSHGASTTPESIVVDVSVGEDYFIIVDGVSGAEDDYTLQLTCARD